jgi:hypothetical protein
MGKINSRDKGKSAEREVIGLLQEMIPKLKLERNLDQTRDGGYDIKGLDGWAPEVKRYAKIDHADVERFWKQAVEQSSSCLRKPVLFMRADREPWVVVVRLTDMLDDFMDDDDSLDMTCQLTMTGFYHVWRMHDWGDL